jgi:DNA-binding transcriptional regulator YiaG
MRYTEDMRGWEMEANELRERREALDLSIYDLAREFRVAPSSVHRWERGDVKLHGLTAVGADTVLRRLERRAARASAGDEGRE